MPKTYTLSPDKLAASLRKTRLLFGGMLLTVLLLYVLIQGSATRDWTSILLTVAVSLLLLAFAWRNVVRQQTALWESVRIELGEDYVARQQLRVAQLRIARSEVHAIEETGDGLRLRGADKRPLLAIPTALADADYQEIRATLSTWAPIESKSSQARTQSRLLNALSVVSILVLFFSPWLWPTLVAGIISLGILGYGWWELRQGRGVDPQYRRSVRAMLGLVLFVLAAKLCFLGGLFQALLDALRSAGG